MLPVSLDCPFLIAPSVFSNVYITCGYIIFCQGVLVFFIIFSLSDVRYRFYPIVDCRMKKQYVLDTTKRK
jgi:hypothetical protein